MQESRLLEDSDLFIDSSFASATSTLMQEMLEVDPNRRPTASELRERFDRTPFNQKTPFRPFFSAEELEILTGRHHVLHDEDTMWRDPLHYTTSRLTLR